MWRKRVTPRSVSEELPWRPRGEGYWAFELRAGDRKRHIFINATYAEARKQALERATQEGYHIVSVLT